VAGTMSLSYNYPPQMAYPSAPPVYRGLPAPPRLHWGWVFALSLVTLGLFGMVWMVVVGWWVKKATGREASFWWSLAYLLVIPASIVLGIVGVLVSRMGGDPTSVYVFTKTASGVMRLASFVLYLVAAFGTKSALEERPIEIPLSGVMTFFFGSIYFQYHLHDYSVEGRVGEQLSGFEGASVATQAPPQT
jgi:hypothetical protein